MSSASQRDARTQNSGRLRLIGLCNHSRRLGELDIATHSTDVISAGHHLCHQPIYHPTPHAE